MGSRQDNDFVKTAQEAAAALEKFRQAEDALFAMVTRIQSLGIIGEELTRREIRETLIEYNALLTIPVSLGGYLD